MSDTAVATPPVESTPAPAAAPSTGGIDAMMAQLDSAYSSGTNVKVGDDAKPAETPKPGEKAPEVKAAAKPPETAKAPDAKPGEVKPGDKPADEPDWSKAPPKWYKIYEGHKQKTGETIKSLEAKIKSLESKPFEQAGDAKKLEAYEKQLEEMRGKTTDYERRLAQLDYTKSAEYRAKFIEPANRVYSEAVNFVQRLKVTDGEGQRAATQGDFDYLRQLPPDVRRKAAVEMFGDNAADVIDYARDIDRFKRDAAQAAEHHAAEYDRIALEKEGKSKQEAKQYDDFYKSALDGIKGNEKWGKWFSEDEADPEASKLLRDGFDEIERISATVDRLPLDQQAAYAALYRARAAATPRLMLEVNRVSAERDALREELEKIRGTDPGAKPKNGVEKNEEKKPMGIDGAVAVFDQMPR